MAQERRRNNNRRRASQRRRAYDQARDPQRRPQQRRRTQGYQETTLDLATGQVSHNTQATRQNAARSADNSIQFPQQQRRNPNHNNTQRPQNGQRRRSGSNQNQRDPQRLRPTEANLRSPSRREGKKRRKLTRAAIRRRRIIRRLTAFALLLCVIAAGVYLTMTMLFKISSIQVQTADGAQVSEAGGYTSEQILQALGVHTEENIFSFDPAQKSQELEKVFPMLEFIHVQRQYPGTVVVQVTEAQPAYAMQTDSGWLTLSGSLKIIAKDSAQPAGLATLYGGEPVSTNPGDQLEFAAEAVADSAASDSASSGDAASEAAQPAEDKRLASLNELMDALDTHGMLGDVTRIEFADPEQMAFLYQNRISVLLGTLNELEYKLKLADYVLLNQDGKGCAETDTGLLDLSHLSASTTRKFRFAQGEPTLPSGFVVTDPPTNQAQPEAEPTAEPAEDSTENAEAVENPEQATPEQAPPEAADPNAAPAKTPAETAPVEATPAEAAQ